MKRKSKGKGNIKRRRFLIKKKLQLHFGLITFCLLMISSFGVWFLMNSVISMSLSNMGSVSLELTEFLNKSNWIIWTVIMANGVAIFLLCIYFSHQIAGPIYRIEKSLTDLIENKKTRLLKLRKYDLLHETADLVNQLINKQKV